MTIYNTFMRGDRLNTRPANLKLYRRRIYFADQALDAGNGDVHEVFPVSAGQIVLAAWVNVAIKAPDYATIDLGYGDVVNYWGNALPIDAVGHSKAILTGSLTWDAYLVKDKSSLTDEIDIDGAAIGDHVTVSSGVDLADMLLSGHVIHPDRVAVQLYNNTGGELDLPSQTVTAIVNKAPLAGTPMIFTGADTIDIKATTDFYDVDINSGVIDVYALILV